MNLFRSLLSAAVAAGITVGSAGIAEAAPIVLVQAVLTAAEFPQGSTGYGTRTTTIRFKQALTDSACDRTTRKAARQLAGVLAVGAGVRRAGTQLSSVVVNRPFTQLVIDSEAACGSPEGTKTLATPGDLARLRPHVVAYTSKQYQGWVDVRGITITVEAQSESSPLDTTAFWQTFRAQIAKVERQP